MINGARAVDSSMQGMLGFPLLSSPRSQQGLASPACYSGEVLFKAIAASSISFVQVA